ncbi:hypothetical protein D3P03_26860, partial [Escherichia coli]
ILGSILGNVARYTIALRNFGNFILFSSAQCISFSTKQRRTPAVAAARMDWVMSPSSGDALLCFVKRAVPAGSKCTNWYRQSSGCCGAGADLRLAVISDSHGRLIAPPNSSFPQ